MDEQWYETVARQDFKQRALQGKRNSDAYDLGFYLGMCLPFWFAMLIIRFIYR